MGRSLLTLNKNPHRRDPLQQATRVAVFAAVWLGVGCGGTGLREHSATLLPSGKVLIVGDGTGAGAKVYDPSAGNFADTHACTARKAHTATLLPDGKVLIAGGRQTLAHLASADLYDPATGNFATTGLMTDRRSSHTATLLPNGKVLLTGGWVERSSKSGSSDTAELYDPALGVFTATETMARARSEHTATLLPNGKVLIVGGHTSTFDLSTVFKKQPRFLATAELFDPATRAFTATGSMAGPKARHTATLLPNGKVLIVGGTAGSDHAPSGTAELYDPATGVFAPSGSLAKPRSEHTATLLPNGKVLITGGVAEDGTPFASAKLYDPATGGIAPTGNLVHARSGHTATLLPDGKVLIVGGTDGRDQAHFGSVEIYDPATGVFRDGSIAPK